MSARGTSTWARSGSRARSHLDEGTAATAFVRPHDVRVAAGEGGDARATVERVATLGWLARLSLKLDGGETLVAHVPHDELHGAKEGDEVWVDLRNPKAFVRPESVEAEGVTLEDEEIRTP